MSKKNLIALIVACIWTVLVVGKIGFLIGSDALIPVSISWFFNDMVEFIATGYCSSFIDGYVLLSIIILSTAIVWLIAVKFIRNNNN